MDLVLVNVSLEENRVFVFLFNGWASAPSQNVLTLFDDMQVLFPFLRMQEKESGMKNVLFFFVLAQITAEISIKFVTHDISDYERDGKSTKTLNSRKTTEGAILYLKQMARYPKTSI